jgi:hypothetical protein
MAVRGRQFSASKSGIPYAFIINNRKPKPFIPEEGCARVKAGQYFRSERQEVVRGRRPDIRCHQLSSHIVNGESAPENNETTARPLPHLEFAWVALKVRIKQLGMDGQLQRTCRAAWPTKTKPASIPYAWK